MTPKFTIEVALKYIKYHDAVAVRADAREAVMSGQLPKRFEMPASKVRMTRIQEAMRHVIWMHEYDVCSLRVARTTKKKAAGRG